MMYALVDCNNFYASCERLFRPDLASKPVAVLSNNDGCIISRSAEIKEMGIPMGAPFFKVRDALKKGGASIFSANFTLYGDLSERVMNVLQGEVSQSEVYSIDECFLDLSHLPFHSLGEFSRQLKDKVERDTGIPVSIGVAPSKTLAKLANQVAKKHPRSNGCWLLMGTEDQRLDSMDVGDVWGVGRRIKKHLNAMGVQSVKQFRDMPKGMVRKHFGVVGERTVQELNGIPCVPLEPDASVRQRIQVSRSFGQPIRNEVDLGSAVASFVDRGARKLRKQNSMALGMVVYVRSSPFRNGDDYFRTARRMEWPTGNDDTLEMTGDAISMVKDMFQPNVKFAKAGITLEPIVPVEFKQYDFFYPGSGKREASMIMDVINNRYDSEVIKVASCGQSSRWKMNQNYRSPRYTTRWSDIPVVK